MEVTRYEADLLLRLVRKALPRARRTAEKKIAAGVPATLPGRDADLVRLENLERLEQRLIDAVRSAGEPTRES